MKSLPSSRLLLLTLLVCVFWREMTSGHLMWPTTDPQMVCSSFGTYERIDDSSGSRPPNLWHDGLDIPGVPYCPGTAFQGVGSITEIRAAHTGQIASVERMGNTKSIRILIEPNDFPGQLETYEHCEELPQAHPRFVNLYTGGYDKAFKTTCQKYLGKEQNPDYDATRCRVFEGQSFAAIAEPGVVAHTAFAHLHYRFGDDPRYQPQQLERINPLVIIGPAPLTDPYDVRPTFGPLYIRQFSSGTYLSANHGLFGKVQVLEEITDAMAPPDACRPVFPLPTGMNDPDIWGSTGTQQRFSGFRATPYRILFSILNANQDIVYPNAGKQGLFEFLTIDYHHDFPLTSLLYEAQKYALAQGQKPWYAYVYKLTNLLPGSAPPSEERYWNTRVLSGKDDVTEDPADNAPISRQAKYPDGNYTLVIDACDLVGCATPSNEAAVIVDNFLPYVERLKVNAGSGTLYEAGWEFVAASQQLEWQWTQLPQPFTPSETLHLRVQASETLTDVTVRLGADTVALSATDEEQMTWEGTLAAPDDTPLAVLTITGHDTAGNALLPFADGLPKRLPVRDDAGAWACSGPNCVLPSNAGDTAHQLGVPHTWSVTTPTASVCEQDFEQGRVSCFFGAEEQAQPLFGQPRTEPDRRGVVTLGPATPDPEEDEAWSVALLDPNDAAGFTHKGLYMPSPEGLELTILPPLAWLPACRADPEEARCAGSNPEAPGHKDPPPDSTEPTALDWRIATTQDDDANTCELAVTWQHDDQDVPVFLLNADSFAALRDRAVPDAVIGQLLPLENVAFSSEAALCDALRKQVSWDDWKAHKEKILPAIAQQPATLTVMLQPAALCRHVPTSGTLRGDAACVWQQGEIVWYRWIERELEHVIEPFTFSHPGYVCEGIARLVGTPHIAWTSCSPNPDWGVPPTIQTDVKHPGEAGFLPRQLQHVELAGCHLARVKIAPCWADGLYGSQYYETTYEEMYVHSCTHCYQVNTDSEFLGYMHHGYWECPGTVWTYAIWTGESNCEYTQAVHALAIADGHIRLTLTP